MGHSIAYYTVLLLLEYKARRGTVRRGVFSNIGSRISTLCRKSLWQWDLGCFLKILVHEELEDD